MELNYKDIRDLIKKKSYLASGRDYFKHGVVSITSIKGSSVKSEVVGSHEYQVTLKHNGQYLDGKCSCPAYKYYGPCKHMAATGFALIHSDRKEYRESLGCINDRAYCEKLLLKREKKDLISIIMRLNGEHPEIIEDLEDEEYEKYKKNPKEVKSDTINHNCGLARKFGKYMRIIED